MFCGTSVQAQTSAKKAPDRIAYYGSVQTGLQAGSSDIDISAQILNGIQYKSWVLGIGTGYDGYGLPGIPITLYGQKSFTTLKHKPFVYAQSGMAIALKVNEWNVKAFGKDVYEPGNGFTAEFGVGYQWKVGKKIQLLANTGFAYKHHEVLERQVYYIWSSVYPPEGYPDKFNTIDYYYRRFVCRFGISF